MNKKITAREYDTLKAARLASLRSAEGAKAAILNGTAQYGLSGGSNGYTYLKVDGYGYVGKVRGGKFEPMNVGVEVPRKTLIDALDLLGVRNVNPKKKRPAKKALKRPVRSARKRNPVQHAVVVYREYKTAPYKGEILVVFPEMKDHNGNVTVYDREGHNAASQAFIRQNTKPARDDDKIAAMRRKLQGLGYALEEKAPRKAKANPAYKASFATDADKKHVRKALKAAGYVDIRVRGGTKRAPSPYNNFVKAQMPLMKAKGFTHAASMKEIGRLWKKK